MTALFLGMIAGFAGGVLYSRNKANPVQASLNDLKRGARAICDIAQRAAGRMARSRPRYK